MQKRPTPRSVLAWAVAISLIQGFDVAVHVASGQLEPLRVVASLIVTVWAVLAVVRGDVARRTVVAALGAYLALNAVFVALEGVTNPAQGDAVRWVLFALVAATTITVLGLTNARAAGPTSRPT